MFEEHVYDRTYINIMKSDILYMDEMHESGFTSESVSRAISKIFPMANVDVCGSMVHATIYSPLEQFGKFSSENGCYTASRTLSREEDYIWSCFAKLLKILRDNPIVEVKVRVSTCLPETSTKEHDEADLKG